MKECSSFPNGNADPIAEQDIHVKNQKPKLFFRLLGTIALKSVYWASFPHNKFYLPQQLA